jgi:hypothetical protein
MTFSKYAMAANRILFALAYMDERRGFMPMGDLLLWKCVDIKNDYVRMAEEALARGEPWEPEDFNRLCRDGLERLLLAQGQSVDA